MSRPSKPVAGGQRKPDSAPRSARGTEPSRGTERLRGGAAKRWTFLSNHAHVLVCLAQDPDVRLREVAQRIGITERAVQKILSDLEAEGLVQRTRSGRRNVYELNFDRPLRHPVEKHCQVSDLMALLLGTRPQD